MTLVSELGQFKLALQAAIKDAFKTPEVIAMFAKREPAALRIRLAKLQEEAKLGRLAPALFKSQAVEVIVALKRLGEKVRHTLSDGRPGERGDLWACLRTATPCAAPRRELVTRFARSPLLAPAADPRGAALPGHRLHRGEAAVRGSGQGHRGGCGAVDGGRRWGARAVMPCDTMRVSHLTQAGLPRRGLLLPACSSQAQQTGDCTVLSRAKLSGAAYRV